MKFSNFKFVPALLLIATSALASLSTGNTITEINVPQMSGGLILQAAALYLQPNVTGGVLDYANWKYNGTQDYHVKSVDPDYNWGWSAAIGFIFPNTANDINLSYTSLNTSDSNSQTVGKVFPAHVIYAGWLETGHAVAATDFDQVNLTGGQYINVGSHLLLHFNAGASYVGIQQSLNSDYHGNPAPHVLLLWEKSNFNGVGPMASVDANYHITHGLGIVGHAASALYVGNIDCSSNRSLDDPHIKSFGTETTRHTVPWVDLKLGGDYSFPFQQTSSLTLEVGYEGDEYFNAVDSLTNESPKDPSTGIHRTTDLSFNGPYASLTYRG